MAKKDTPAEEPKPKENPCCRRDTTAVIEVTRADVIETTVRCRSCGKSTTHSRPRPKTDD